jgi:hypothetical protein
LALRERINDAFVEELAPDLSGWGLRITRTAGQKWDLAEYEQIETLRALREREAASNDIEKKRAEQKHEMAMLSLQLESERDLRKQADELALNRGKWEARDLEHQYQVDRDRRERAAQFEAKKRYDELRHEDRRREHQLEQQRLDAQLRRDIEKGRAETEQWQERASFMATLPPEQIVARFADRNPHLVPALEAYWRSQAGAAEMKLLQEFQERLRQLFGDNEKRVTQVMETAIAQIGQTAQTGLKSSQVQVVPHGDNVVAITAKPDQQPGGRLICGACRKLIPREKVLQKICPECGQPVDQS